MTGLYVFLSVVLMLVLLLISPFCLLLHYENGDIRILLRYLFIKFQLFPKREKKPPRKKEGKAKSPPKKSQSEPEKQNIGELLAFMRFFMKESAREIAAVRNYIILDKIHFRCKIAGEDAADTAIKYGELQILAGITFATLRNFFKLKFDVFSIAPDFTGEENDLRLSLTVRMPFAVALFIGIRFFIRLVLEKLDDENGGKVYGKASD